MPDVAILAPAPAAPDTTDYAAIHRSIRSAGHALAAAAATLRTDDDRRIDAFLRYWRGHQGEILSHHGVEDDVFFPALRERAPLLHRVLDLLDEEHHLLDRLMDETRAAIEEVASGAEPAVAVAPLRRLAEVMDQHLDLEDGEIVPRFGEHFTASEYDELTKRAIKLIGFGKQAAFTVPYVGYWAMPAEREALLGSAPLPFRVLYRLTRRRHNRLTRLALGDAATPAAAAA